MTAHSGWNSQNLVKKGTKAYSSSKHNCFLVKITKLHWTTKDQNWVSQSTTVELKFSQFTALQNPPQHCPRHQATSFGDFPRLNTVAQRFSKEVTSESENLWEKKTAGEKKRGTKPPSVSSRATNWKTLTKARKTFEVTGERVKFCARGPRSAARYSREYFEVHTKEKLFSTKGDWVLFFLLSLYFFC